MAFPCSLVLANDTTRYLSFTIRNNNPLPSGALPVFCSPQHARQFDEEVLKLTDTKSYEWTVSMCRNTNEATFHTYTRVDARQSNLVQPKLFDIEDTAFLHHMLVIEIAFFLVESFYYNKRSNDLIVEGILCYSRNPIHDYTKAMCRQTNKLMEGFINLSSSIDIEKKQNDN